MISAGDFRKGITLEMENGLDHRGFPACKARAKARPLFAPRSRTSSLARCWKRTFNPTDKFPRAHIETKEMEYLYNDGELYYFMDLETYEQLPLNKEAVEDAIPYVKENTNVTVRFFKARPSRWSRRTS